MYQKVLLIKSQASDELEILKIVEYIEQNHKASVDFIFLDSFLDLDELDKQTLYITFLSDENVKILLAKVMNLGVDVLILANKECFKAIKSYNLMSDFKESIDSAFLKKNLSSIDILMANDIVVYNSVVFGDVYGINKKILPTDSLHQRVKEFFSNLKKIKYHAYKIETKEGNEIDTAAIGVVVYEHNLKESSDRLVGEDKSLYDGQLNALILAPKSIFALLYLLFILFFYRRFLLSKLPKSIGLIKSEALNVTSNQRGLDFLIDGVGLSSKSVSIEVHKSAINLHLGKNFDAAIQSDENRGEVLQVKHLPKGEYKKLLQKNSLPLFKKAGQEDFKDLFISLKSAATLGSIYIVLMVCSTLLATVGLFLDSGPVIIGAMILAPLMAPIVSLSMGVVRNDSWLIQSSANTIFIGILLALFSAAIFTLFMPVELRTAQIEARLQPNILDMFVAIFSGIAAAYAYSKEEVAKSLAGVAIAVALVPPLAVTGIGIGWVNFDVIFGSFLLFVTNLVGITIAASITFIVLGFAPMIRAKKGILYTAITMVVVSIPLGYAFWDIVWQNKVQSKISSQRVLELTNMPIEYKVLSIERSRDGLVSLEIEVISREILNRDDMIEIKSLLEDKLDEKIELKLNTKLII